VSVVSCHVKVSATGRSLVRRRPTESCVLLSMFSCSINSLHVQWVGRRDRIREEERKRENKERNVCYEDRFTNSLFLITFHYNPYLRFIKFEMVFECWIVLRRSRWILMAMYVGDENLNGTKKWLYLACTFLQSIKRATWRLPTCHVQVDIMRTGSSQWSSFSCITRMKVTRLCDDTFKCFTFTLYTIPLMGELLIQKLGDCFARSNTQLRAVVCLP